MLKPGRNASSSDYRYGFNGMEPGTSKTVNELKYNFIVVKSNTARSPLGLLDKKVEHDLLGDVAGWSGIASHLLKKAGSNSAKPKHPVQKAFDFISAASMITFRVSKGMVFLDFTEYTYRFDQIFNNQMKEMSK